MSRHRNIRNIDLDEYYGDGFDDEDDDSDDGGKIYGANYYDEGEEDNYDDQGDYRDEVNHDARSAAPVAAATKPATSVVGAASQPAAPSKVAIAMITDLGFSKAQAEKALLANNNVVEAATAWLLDGGEGVEDSEPVVVSIKSSGGGTSSQVKGGAVGVGSGKGGAGRGAGWAPPGSPAKKGGGGGGGGGAAKGKGVGGGGGSGAAAANTSNNGQSSERSDSDVTAMGLKLGTSGGKSKGKGSLTVELPSGTSTSTTSGGGADGGVASPGPKSAGSGGRSTPSPGSSPFMGSTPLTPTAGGGGGGGKVTKLLREINAEVEAALANTAAKPVLSLVVAGHVDHGKSTLMGHFLFRLNEVSQKQMHKFQKDAAVAGKASFSFAWVMDGHEEERARGITMDVATTQLETRTQRLTLLDCPGHRDYIPEMIAGAAQADAALLVVSAAQGEFEAGFKGQGQTKEHAILVRALGVRKLLVAINKMDCVAFSKDRFDEVCAELTPFLTHTDFDFTFIPCSGLSGLNLTDKSGAEVMPWFEGPTILEAVEAIPPAVRETDKPFRMSVTDLYQSTTMGAVAVAGKVEAGILRVSERVLAMPAAQLVKVKGIETNGATPRFLLAGENADVGLADIDPLLIQNTLFLCDASDAIPLTNRFRASIMVLDIRIPITRGYQVVFHSQNQDEAAAVTKLIRTRSAKVIKENPRRIGRNEHATVIITTERPVCIEEYSKCGALGRFMLRDGGVTIACGIVDEVLFPKAAKDRGHAVQRTPK